MIKVPTNEKLEQFDNSIRRYITKPSQITIFIEQIILKPYQFFITAKNIGRSWKTEYFQITFRKVCLLRLVMGKSDSHFKNLTFDIASIIHTT